MFDKVLTHPWRSGCAMQKRSELPNLNKVSVPRKIGNVHAGDRKRPEEASLEFREGRKWLQRALEIEKNPKFQEFVATRKSLGWTLTLRDAGDLLRLHPARRLRSGSSSARRIGAGVMTIGMPVGLAVIVSAFLLDRHLCRQGQRPLRRVDPPDRRGEQVMSRFKHFISRRRPRRVFVAGLRRRHSGPRRAAGDQLGRHRHVRRSS